MKRSASLLIVTPQGKLLLLQRSGDSTHFPGEWEFPGGKTDPAESPHQGVLRETREETGLLVDFPACDPVWRTVTPPGEIEYSFFVWKPAAAELPVVLSSEHQAFA